MHLFCCGYKLAYEIGRRHGGYLFFESCFPLPGLRKNTTRINTAKSVRIVVADKKTSIGKNVIVQISEGSCKRLLHYLQEIITKL